MQNGKAILNTVPPLLQEQFTERFSKLESWEQLMIESSSKRVVSLISAEDIDASLILVTGSLDSIDPK